MLGFLHHPNLRTVGLVIESGQRNLQGTDLSTFPPTARAFRRDRGGSSPENPLQRGEWNSYLSNWRTVLYMPIY